MNLNSDVLLNVQCLLFQCSLTDFSPLKDSTAAVGTCSVPFTVIQTNTTVPTITGAPPPPAYARRTLSWWPRRFRSYEDIVDLNSGDLEENE